MSTKVWDQAGIELVTPGSVVRLASVARHVTDCATRPGDMKLYHKKSIRAIYDTCLIEFIYHINIIGCIT